MTWGLKFAKFRFKAFAANRKDFYEDFAMALRDGAATIDLLKTRAQRARRRRTGLAPLYEHWLHKMRRMSFGYALQHTVPAFETMVLTAAEEDGRIDEAMDYLGRSIEIKGKTQSIYFVSLASPIISAVVLLGFLISYALVIAPEYLQILPLEKWPALTKSIYFLSSALVNNGVFFMALCAASFAAVMWSRPNWYGRIRKRIERLPFNPWSSYRDNESNNFLIALSILLQSNNHGIKEALEMMRRFASPWLAWHITVMLHRLKLTPDRPALALDTGLFNQATMDRIEDYADRTEFNQAIYKLAFDSGERFIKEAQRKAIIVSLIAMLLVAAAILLITMSNMQFAQVTEASMKSL